MVIVLFGGLLAVVFLASSIRAEEMTSGKKLEKAEDLSVRASKLAPKTIKTGYIEFAQKALSLADEASAFLLEVASIAKDTADVELARKAMNAVNKIVVVINNIANAAQYIIKTSADSRAVDAANKILDEIEKVRNQNAATMDIALASGAVLGPAEADEFRERYPFEIPVREEPPIQDLEPASPI